ncbi:MAG TPA: hypothetical protein PL096_01340 [Micropepsaceae bacterium]|nr:hypothetical protein [Micropepsaceae bacterium]
MTGQPKTPESDAARSLKSRNRALAFVLVGFVVLFFVMTLVRLGGNVAERSF